MAAIDVYNEETGELVQAPAGARQLGIRVKPIIRLGLGIKDPERGFPRKTDHFTCRGDDRAVAKFYAEYGEKPKAVEILLPSELDVALTIQYRAFKGASGGDGGTLVAVGHTNYALRDYCGGPDVLTVFNQDGTVEEVETLGLDANTRDPLDAAAKEHGIELYTTFRAGMPAVLGFGSYFEVSTKGKESTDNLWAKLRELYSLFGSRITFAVKPQLVLRPSTARPVVIDKDTKKPKRTTTTIYALDIVVPETIDDMIGRLQTRQAALGSPGAALYGARALEAGPPVAAAPPVEAREPSAGEGGEPAAAESPSPAAAAATDPDADFSDEPGAEPVEEVEAFDEADVDEAGAVVVPNGVNKGKPLAEIATAGPEGEKWLLWCCKAGPEPLKSAAQLYAHARVDSVWAKFEAWQTEQS